MSEEAKEDTPKEIAPARPISEVFPSMLKQQTRPPKKWYEFWKSR